MIKFVPCFLSSVDKINNRFVVDFFGKISLFCFIYRRIGSTVDNCEGSLPTKNLSTCTESQMSSSSMSVNTNENPDIQTDFLNGTSELTL